LNFHTIVPLLVLPAVCFNIIGGVYIYIPNLTCDASLTIMVVFRHFQHIWGGSHDFWQHLWKTVLNLFGGNEPALCIIGKLSLFLKKLFLPYCLLVV